MTLYFNENNKIDIYKTFNDLYICGISYDTIIKNDKKLIIKDYVYNHNMVKALELSNEVCDIIYKYVIGDISEDELMQKIEEEGRSYVVVQNFTNSARDRYKMLSEIEEPDNAVIDCDKNNFYRALDLSKKYNKSTICGNEISISEYYILLSKIGYDQLKENNVQVAYQEGLIPISLIELYELSEFIYDEVEKIKKYNLSPLEKTMYVYDIVKALIYKEEENDDAYSSRDLNELLKSNNLVCVGYVAISTALLNSLGIKAMSLTSTKMKHQIFMAYIKDPKYNIDGVYTFDTVANRRKYEENMTPEEMAEEDKNYLGRYTRFALPLDISNKLVSIDDLEILDYDFDDYYNEYMKCLAGEDDICIKLSFELEDLFNFVNNDNYQEFNDNILYGIEEDLSVAKKEYDNVLSKYKVERIDLERLIKTAYNVRRIQLYEGQIETLSKEDFINIAIENSLPKKDRDIARFYAILGLFGKVLPKTNKMIDKQLQESNYKRDIECVKLTRVLRNRLTSLKK